MARVFIALGGNLGDVLATFRWALARLEAEVGSVVQRSSAYRTVAEVLDDRPAPDYWNAVCEMRSALEPVPLLDALKGIERAAGREMSGPWLPRPLDLDLLLYDERTFDGGGLQVPHPRMRGRAFVLQPLRELAPELALPPDGATPTSLLAAQPWPWRGVLKRQVAWWRSGVEIFGRAVENGQSVAGRAEHPWFRHATATG